MHIQDIFKQHGTTFSFEFFPPKTPQAAEALYETIADLAELKPSFVSVTYGAGGSTRELTHDLVARIKTTTDITPVPHLTCVCHKFADIAAILERYAELGVCNLLALGGDPPRDMPGYSRGDDDFQHAVDLVKFAREFRRPDGRPVCGSRGFGIGVAGFPEGHPGTPNRMLEMDHLKAKVDAGADYICTQLFFDNRDFYDFRERCDLAGIRVPILAGIMPITSAKGMRRMAELAAGSRFPAPLLRAIKRATGSADISGGTTSGGGGEDAVAEVGIHWATEQCRDLLDHQVAGIHFYTLNKSDATRRIYRSLGVADSLALGR